MKPLKSVEEAAGLLGISPWTVRSYIREGKLGPVRLGRRVLVEEAELERLVAEGKAIADTKQRGAITREGSCARSGLASCNLLHTIASACLTTSWKSRPSSSARSASAELRHCSQSSFSPDMAEALFSTGRVVGVGSLEYLFIEQSSISAGSCDGGGHHGQKECR